MEGPVFRRGTGHRLTWAAVLLAVLVVQAGCTRLTGNLAFWHPEEQSKTGSHAKSNVKPGPTQVKTGGDGFALGDVEKSALTPQQFVDHVADTLRVKHHTAAARWVRSYPDVALAVLREPDCVNTSPEVREAIAQAHDQQCTRAAAEANWTALVRDRAREPKRYADYDQKRRQFMEHLQNGRLKEAMALGLAAPPGAPGVMLDADVLYLTGVARMLSDRPKEAVEAFEKASQKTREDHPYQSATLLLLLSDAQRRCGDNARAECTWQEAVQMASELAAGATAVADPILWERLAYLRPANVSWPPAVEQRMADLNVRFGIAISPRTSEVLPAKADSAFGESALWTNIGHWRLARDESQAALVALKRAESMTSDQLAANQLRLSQAKSLARLGQAPAASAMLIGLAGQSDKRVSRPAMAMLGALKLQQGSTQQGFNLLHRAVEEDPGLVWPEHAQAEADLGLAYLLSGEEETGLKWLHNAQKGFESAGRSDQLVQCLENEAAYLEQARKKDLAQAVRKRLEAVQSS